MHGGPDVGATLSLLWVLPFVAMLAGIAVLPLAAPRLWERHRWQAAFAAALAIPVGAYFLTRDAALLGHTVAEYLSFIALLGSLYVVSGGIHIKGGLLPTPGANTAVLAIGAVLASLMGTTGASMLLIRPLLAMNESRRHRVHTVIFFIFIVANAGGCLTPIGDPPLFMGYLKGVPFAWTLGLWRVWLVAVGALLAVYYVWDRRHYRAEVKPEPEALRDPSKLGVDGRVNFALLAGVVLAVAFGQHLPALASGLGLREVALVGLALASLQITPAAVRRANRFSWGPIAEVAILFAGIFVTMVPALAILSARGGELGLRTPLQFFVASGALSSFLDNAPTYVVFFELGRVLGAGGGAAGATLVAGVPEGLLVAISVGTVFMGANTYIGNGPNFMVKAIAEERGVKMPSFVGYMAYSAGVMLPLLALLAVLFVR